MVYLDKGAGGYSLDLMKRGRRGHGELSGGWSMGNVGDERASAGAELMKTRRVAIVVLVAIAN